MSNVSQRISKQYVQIIQAKPERIFPMLCPVEEARWLAGWSYQMIYSKSGVAEEGCVFSTPEGDQQAIWINTLRDQATGHIQFTKVIPDISATLLDIHLAEQGEQTQVTIQYTTTALSDAGQRALELITDELFNRRLAFWEKSMNHYLETGQKLELAA